MTAAPARDATFGIRFAGLLSSRYQTEIGTDVGGRAKALGSSIMWRKVSAVTHANTGDRHQPTCGFVVTSEMPDFPIELLPFKLDLLVVR